MDIGTRIKSARKAAKITQEELGRAVGVSHAAVSLWESGSSKGLKSENLVKCANFLNVDIEWLVTGKGSPGDTPATYNKPVLVKDSEPTHFHIDYTLLEEALKQLDSELNGWHNLTYRRRARLIMSYYEDLQSASEDNKSNRKTISTG
jgi:transcriptional regulator with XRE-family HTH domain